MRCNIYSQNYANPPVPTRYKHVLGDWNNGFVIERSFDGSQLFWIPVMGLKPNGTLDGSTFDQSFGRMNFCNVEFSDDKYHEVFTGELAWMYESVKKYGGFYLSRYKISMDKNSKNFGTLAGRPQSVKGVEPFLSASRIDAKYIAERFESSREVTSHLTYGAEYDSLLKWLIESNVMTLEQITTPINDWDMNDLERRTHTAKTGDERYCLNNICDFADGITEWTQEQYGNSEYKGVKRGTNRLKGNNDSIASYRRGWPNQPSGLPNGFRIAICIK